MFAEKSLVAINNSNKELFRDLILEGTPEMERDSQKAGLKKVLRKL